MNKSGQSTGFSFFYIVVSLFGVGVLFIIFQMVFNSHLVPLIKGQINSTVGMDVATMAATNNAIDRYMTYFNLLPFILFFVAIIYLIAVAVRKEQENQYQ